MKSARVTAAHHRKITRLLLGLLTIAVLAGCGEQSLETPPTTVSPTKAVSPDCLEAMQDQLEGALYRPPAPTSERLEECQAESEEAIQAAAEQLLREAFDDSLASPPASPQP